MNFPEYTSLNGVALRYEGCNEYYRYAGRWSVIVDENLIVTDKSQWEMHYCIGCKLIPIDKETWLRGNDGYVPESLQSI